MQIILIKSYVDKPWRSEETYLEIEAGLSQKWPVKSVVPQSPQQLKEFISSQRSETDDNLFVFNIAEYIDEKKKRGFLPELLEKWQLPHLGSRAATIADSLDKARTKQILEDQGIPTPRYFVAREIDENLQAQADLIGFPLIVKPLMEGGHIGIRDDSVVSDQASLEKIVSWVLKLHQQPALVEEFLTGPGMREFSVGVIAGEPMLFTPIEIDYQAMDVKRRILSYEAAQEDLERTRLVSDAGIRSEIIDLAFRTFEAVDACDYSRVDLRMDSSGCYVLEINTMPGLGPHSFLPEAAKAIYGLDYPALVQRLADGSIRRQLA